MVNAQHKARLTAWIRDRYYGVGLDKNDAFIGKKLFNKRLSPNSEGFSASEIEATVNEMFRTGALMPHAKWMKVSKSAAAAAVTKSKQSDNKSAASSPAATFRNGINVASNSASKAATSPAPAPAAVAPASQTATGVKVTDSLSAKDSKRNITFPSTIQYKPGMIKARELASFFGPTSYAAPSSAPQTTETSAYATFTSLNPKIRGFGCPESIANSLADRGNCNVVDLQNFVHAVASNGEANNDDSSINGSHNATTAPAASAMEQQLSLLSLGNTRESSAALNGGDRASGTDALANAPLFPGAVLRHLPGRMAETTAPPAQYALLGLLDPDSVVTGNVSSGRTASDEVAKDNRLFMNTNVPFSTFICGVQGSGKSHTLSCMIENCILPAPVLGVLQKPLAVLLFHYSECTSRLSFKPNEAAFLAFPAAAEAARGAARLPPPRVTVLAAPSNCRSLRALYGQIPGVRVRPFRLRPRDLNVGTMLTLMAVDRTDAAPPLYMAAVTRILRDLAAGAADDDGAAEAADALGSFDYGEFKRRLGAAGLTPAQLGPLKQRLEQLESFLDLGSGSAESSPLDAAPGSVTIIDMSCPFVDDGTACVMFKIGMDLFLEAGGAATETAAGSGSDVGKVIAVDEAHKFMRDTPGAKALTEALLTVIRQQRHYGARVIISTQEPTVSPRLIDLCAVTVVHRFTSPQWFAVLRRHISAAGSYSSHGSRHDNDDYNDDGDDDDDDDSAASYYNHHNDDDDVDDNYNNDYYAGCSNGEDSGFGAVRRGGYAPANHHHYAAYTTGGSITATAKAAANTLFRQILALQTGEALVFAPSAVVARRQRSGWAAATRAAGGVEVAAGGRLEAVMDRLLKVRMRKRLTWDGGRSVVCV